MKPNTTPNTLAPVWCDCATAMPDADETVLIHHPTADEPVWLGYFDGETWRSVDSTRCEVTHWAAMPEGPKQSDAAPRVPTKEPA